MPGLSDVLVHTGQHFDCNMSVVFFEELGIRKPDYFLDIDAETLKTIRGCMQAVVEKAHACCSSW